MSCKSVLASSLLPDEIGPFVRICIRDEVVAQYDVRLPAQIEDKPAEAPVANPQPNPSVAQNPGFDARIVLGDDSDVFVR